MGRLVGMKQVVRFQGEPPGYLMVDYHSSEGLWRQPHTKEVWIDWHEGRHRGRHDGKGRSCCKGCADMEISAMTVGWGRILFEERYGE